MDNTISRAMKYWIFGDNPEKNIKQEQETLIEQVMERLDCGDESIMSLAHTGSGKTAMNSTIARIIKNEYPGSKIAIITITKQQQEQYSEDSEYPNVKRKKQFYMLRKWGIM